MGEEKNQKSKCKKQNDRAKIKKPDKNYGQRKMGLLIFYVFLKSPHRGRAEKSATENTEDKGQKGYQSIRKSGGRAPEDIGYQEIAEPQATTANQKAKSGKVRRVMPWGKISKKFKKSY